MNPKSLSSTLSLPGTGLAVVATVAVDQGLRANYRKHHLIQGRESGGLSQEVCTPPLSCRDFPGKIKHILPKGV